MPVFDSNGFVKRLVLAGMPEGQAEVLAHEQIQLLSDHLATKDDLRALESRILFKTGVMIATMGGLLFAALSLVFTATH